MWRELVAILLGVGAAYYLWNRYSDPVIASVQRWMRANPRSRITQVLLTVDRYWCAGKRLVRGVVHTEYGYQTTTYESEVSEEDLPVEIRNKNHHVEDITHKVPLTA